MSGLPYDGEDPAKVDWTKHPALPLKAWGETPAGYGGAAQLAWNDKGLFVRVAVRDAKFVHEDRRLPMSTARKTGWLTRRCRVR